MAKTFSSPLESNAGQLFQACIPSVCVNMHHMSPVWKHSSCKRVGMTEPLKDVAGIHLRTHRAGLMYPKTLHKPFHTRPLIDKCGSAASWKSMISSSPGFQASGSRSPLGSNSTVLKLPFHTSLAVWRSQLGREHGRRRLFSFSDRPLKDHLAYGLGKEPLLCHCRKSFFLKAFLSLPI